MKAILNNVILECMQAMNKKQLNYFNNIIADFSETIADNLNIEIDYKPNTSNTRISLGVLVEQLIKLSLGCNGVFSYNGIDLVLGNTEYEIKYNGEKQASKLAKASELMIYSSCPSTRGLWLISKKDSKKIVGKKLTNLDIKKYGVRFEI